MTAEYMDVIVSIKVGLGDCEDVGDAYDKARYIAQKAIEKLGPTFEVDDWYEVFRDKNGACTDWE